MQIFFSKEKQEGVDFKEMSLVYTVDVVVVVVVVQQCSQLLNRVRTLYKIQRVYSFHCWYNRNAVDLIVAPCIFVESLHN